MSSKCGGKCWRSAEERGRARRERLRGSSATSPGVRIRRKSVPPRRKSPENRAISQKKRSRPAYSRGEPAPKRGRNEAESGRDSRKCGARSHPLDRKCGPGGIYRSAGAENDPENRSEQVRNESTGRGAEVDRFSPLQAKITVQINQIIRERVYIFFLVPIELPPTLVNRLTCTPPPCDHNTNTTPPRTYLQLLRQFLRLKLFTAELSI